jgi:hypothetical protein
VPARCEWCGVKNVLTGMPPVLPHASCGALLYKDSACAISWLVPQASVQVSGELAIETQCGQGRRGMVRGTARAHHRSSIAHLQGLEPARAPPSSAPKPMSFTSRRWENCTGEHRKVCQRGTGPQRSAPCCAARVHKGLFFLLSLTMPE